MSDRHPTIRRRLASIAGVVLAALLLPATALATDSDAINTDFAVTVDGCDVTLTATAGPDEHESGSFGIYQDAVLMVEGEYEISTGETLSFGPYTLATGSYLLVWDNEPGHNPSQSHQEIAFDVVCEVEEPTPTPTPSPTDAGVAPTTGVNPTKRPNDPKVTLPPTDAIAEQANAASQSAWPVAIGLGLIAGVVLLATPRRATVANRNRR
jgi:hypothetical protein